MKRKPTTPNDAPVISKELLERARRAIETEMNAIPRVLKCSVCGSECPPGTTNSTEPLCWVCRRLKISAWKDTDTQMPAQE